ncbi:MAG TPA: hypothetical protein QGF58_00550 [Myxococcota bacterium]|nr:hypothetical protein [Myxococcota bacterium]
MFGSLPGRWEIKCSGGEAFAHPLFLQFAVPGLMETDHDISVLTNFSASHTDLMRFAALTRGRLKVFSASLHLEFTTLRAFADKAAWFVAQLDPEVDFVVNQVVLPSRLDEARRCRDELEDRGLRWFAQWLKVRGHPVDYDGDIEALVGSRPANRSPSFRGRPCFAGALYFTVDADGSAWSCRTAKRRDEGRMGNLLHGSVALGSGASPCPYDICPCTVPVNRGMVQ